VLASGTLRARGREPRGAAERGHGQWPSGRPAEEEIEEGKEKGEEDVDVWALGVGGKGKRGRTWAGLAAREREERKRERSSGWEGAGPRRGPRGEERGEGRGELGRAKGFGAAFFPSSFPFLHSNHSNNSI
jgi:hypothetical protein